MNHHTLHRDQSTESRFSGDRYPSGELTGQILAAFYEVYNTLGFGYLESAYRRALSVELGYLGISAKQEVPFELTYRGVAIGTYRADLIVGGAVVVETKTGLALDPSASAQVLNYLRATRLQVGLVLHFGPKPSIKRVVATRRESQDQNGGRSSDPQDQLYRRTSSVWLDASIWRTTMS